MNYKELKFYKENLNEVLHTNLNPYEPGVVRIHLVPAKYNPFKANPSIVILNGKDILPINLSWTILLAIFIKEVNAFKGKEVTEEQLKDVITATVNKALKVYRKPGRITLREDLNRILSVFIDIAEGREPQEKSSCACACAGSGRAGCSKKDFYGTNLTTKKLKKVLK